MTNERLAEIRELIETLERHSVTNISVGKARELLDFVDELMVVPTCPDDASGDLVIDWKKARELQKRLYGENS